MSLKSYAKGFCKYAQDNGMDPKVLASFALKVAADGGMEAVKERMEETAKRVDEAQKSISDYAAEHPILGGAALGASSPIASGAKSVGSVAAPIGSVAASPLSVVTGPVGASSAASSGGDVAKGSAVGSAAPGAVGGAILGGAGSSVGAVAGSALSPLTAPIGASVGASVGAADPLFDKMVEEDEQFEAKKKQMDDESKENQEIFRRWALERLADEGGASTNNTAGANSPRK